MEYQGSIGGLLPLWILGAPLVWSLYELYTTPRPMHRTERQARHDRPGPATPSGAGMARHA